MQPLLRGQYCEYKLEYALGTGSQGNVAVATNTKTGEMYAVKIVDTSNPIKKDLVCR